MNPLFITEEGIRKSVLKKTPLGTSIEEVRTFIFKKRWKITQEWNGTFKERDEKNYPYVSGSSFMEATVGRYIGGYVNVEAFWGFDDENKLIDVKIRKTYDDL